MAIIISTRTLEPGDFDDWKLRFESASTARGNAGCRGVRRFRSIDDPNEITVIFDWDSHESARQFIEGNARAIQERNPDAPPPNIHTIYMEELPQLDS